MKFSRNPVSGILEAYTDDGVFIGQIRTMGDDAVKPADETEPTSRIMEEFDPQGNLGETGEGWGDVE